MSDSLKNDLVNIDSANGDSCGADSCNDDSCNDEIVNPVEQFLRSDRVPHIWCPGCGIGTTVNSFARALIDSKIDLDRWPWSPASGARSRAGYVKLDSFHTTHGRAIPFATGLKLANPKLNVVVYSGDGDLSAIGGNHLIHAARRNIDLKVICVNNLIYAMTGGQTAPTTPIIRRPRPIPTAYSSRRSICRTWSKPPAQYTSPAGPPSTCASSRAPSARRLTRKASPLLR